MNSHKRSHEHTVCIFKLACLCAGVGRLGLMDADQVESSNLHRQVLSSERGRAGRKKRKRASKERKGIEDVECVSTHASRSSHGNAYARMNDLFLNSKGFAQITRTVQRSQCCILFLPHPLSRTHAHTQIMHSEARVGCNKAESGSHACSNLNSLVPVEVLLPACLPPSLPPSKQHPSLYRSMGRLPSVSSSMASFIFETPRFLVSFIQPSPSLPLSLSPPLLPPAPPLPEWTIIVTGSLFLSLCGECARNHQEIRHCS